MKKGKRKLLILSLLILFAMAFTWYSCSKQDEVVQKVTKYTIEDFKRALFEAEKKYDTNVNSLELRGDSITSCFDPDTLGKDCDDFKYLGRDSAIVNVYDNCKAKVVYDRYRCFQGHQNPGQPPVVIFTFYIDNFTATPIETECDSVILLWNDLIENEKWDYFLESSETFLRDAQKATEMHVIEDFFNSGNGTMGIFFRCKDFNTTLFSEFYTSNCYQTYLKIWIKGGRFDWDRKDVKCGESCCKSTTLYCLKQDKTIFASDPVIEQVGDCENLEVIYPGKGYFPIGDCNHDCGNN